jgi:hypothetical protein
MVARVALVAALAGAVMGLLQPAYQVAIEPAQVLAGLVSYPPDNPFHLYESRLWTLWHQLLAPLLAFGVSERALAIATSAAVAAIAFAALALMAFAHGARPVIALATPFVMVLLVRPETWGFNYPILLVGEAHTYGTAGLAWIVLATALLGAGCSRAAAFAIGLAPALHASVGAMFGALVGIVAIVGARELFRPRIVWAGAAGLAISIASLVGQRLAFPTSATIDPALATRLLRTFVELWDMHRHPGDLAAWNALLVCCALLFAVVLLRFERGRLPQSNAISLRVFLACGVAGALVHVALWYTPLDRVPAAALVAMPTRFLNFAALAFLPLAIGVADRFRAQPAARWMLVLVPTLAVLWNFVPAMDERGESLLALLPLWIAVRQARSGAAWRIAVVGLFAFFALRWRSDDAAGLGVVVLATAALLLASFLCEARLGRAVAKLRAAISTSSLRALVARFEATTARLDGAIVLAFAAAVVAAVVQADVPWHYGNLVDRSNDAALAAAAQADGLIVPGPGVDRVQLRTRRPVLLDPQALDMLPYALAAGPELVRILGEVYGIDYFGGPPAGAQAGVVPDQPARAIWEIRSVEQWTALRARFGISHVLVRSSWKLKLPVVAHSPLLVLHAIPEPATSP